MTKGASPNSVLNNGALSPPHACSRTTDAAANKSLIFMFSPTICDELDDQQIQKNPICQRFVTLA
jgi:hypothetical protein